MGYHDLGADIIVVGCWAHARRKFDEAVKSLPKGKTKGSSAAQGLAYCNLLFGIEQEIADKTAEERYAERLKQAKPVLDAMFAWANTRTAAPKSALGKALHYLKEQWPYLTNYSKDGRLEISNNRAERSIKPFVIDRKNFLFANTPKGASGSAVMFSMIQTAIENGLDPVHIGSEGGDDDPLVAVAELPVQTFCHHVFAGSLYRHYPVFLLPEAPPTTM